MLYLVKSNGFYKIGYSGDIEQRMQNYKCDNQCYKFIGVRVGDRKDENVLHQKYKEYCVNDSEWMKLPKNVLKEIKNLFGKIDEERLNIISEFCRRELIDKGLSQDQIDFLEICLKCSDKPTEDKPFNYFYKNNELERLIKKHLHFKNSKTEEIYESLKEQYIVIPYGYGYMINPNYLYIGDVKFKKELYISQTLLLSFDGFDSIGTLFKKVNCK